MPKNTPVKTLVIAGSSSGLGHALQARFSAGGYHLVPVSRHGTGHVHADLSDARATAELFQSLDASKPLAGVIPFHVCASTAAPV